ncbi:hypothetical protein VNI00_018259 [Paramarasmius palmivorus]|uniref:Uncharacterized protein n=1 Tax=Paramarasmius palmivorus TaxID=297713 RepID=A0AAW0AYM7_9AGAR
MSSRSDLGANKSMLAIIMKSRLSLILIANGFKCSEKFVGDFFESVMAWSLRHGTRAAAHVPDNAELVIEECFYRHVHLSFLYDIPPSLDINMDQTGIISLMTHNTTYHDKGDKQVPIHGKDEKRSYTLCVANKPQVDNFFLLASLRLVQQEVVARDDKSEGMGQGKEQLQNINCAAADVGNPYDPQSSHQAGLTAVSFETSHNLQVENGITPDKIRFTTSLAALRNASVKPSVNVYEFFQSYDGSQIVCRAWEKCSVKGGFNFSGECITSRRAKDAYRRYLMENPKFKQEIIDKIGFFHEPAPANSNTAQEANHEDDLDETVDDDSSDVPIATIVQRHLDVQLADPPKARSCVDDEAVLAREMACCSAGLNKRTSRLQ